MSIHKEPNKEALRLIHVNTTIQRWMGEELTDTASPYCTSLDAMRRAEERLANDKAIMLAYTLKLIPLVHAENCNSGLAQCWLVATAPAHIRAEALAEVLREIENGI